MSRVRFRSDRRGAVEHLKEATADLDIGLIISNAGASQNGSFMTLNLDQMKSNLNLNALAHLEIARAFGPRLVERRKGGMLFVGAMSAQNGVPYMVNDAAGKAYVYSFAQGLHAELRDRGVYVTLLATPPTDTPALTKLGLSADKLPMRPMRAQQVASEALAGLANNRAVVVPGLMNRIMRVLIPPAVTRSMMGSLFRKNATH